MRVCQCVPTIVMHRAGLVVNSKERLCKVYAMRSSLEEWPSLLLADDGQLCIRGLRPAYDLVASMQVVPSLRVSPPAGWSGGAIAITITISPSILPKYSSLHHTFFVD